MSATSSCVTSPSLLVAKDAINLDESLKSLNSDAEDIVSYLKNRGYLTTKPVKMQEVNGKKRLMLKQECEIRPNSIHLIAERFIDLNEDVMICLTSQKLAPIMITSSTLKVLEEVVKILQPFFQM